MDLTPSNKGACHAAGPEQDLTYQEPETPSRSSSPSPLFMSSTAFLDQEVQTSDHITDERSELHRAKELLAAASNAEAKARENAEELQQVLRRTEIELKVMVAEKPGLVKQLVGLVCRSKSWQIKYEAKQKELDAMSALYEQSTLARDEAAGQKFEAEQVVNKLQCALRMARRRWRTAQRNLVVGRRRVRRRDAQIAELNGKNQDLNAKYEQLKANNVAAKRNFEAFLDGRLHYG